jgi:trehalose-phosphatase
VRFKVHCDRPAYVLQEARRVLTGPTALIILDYDGTITPIVERPEQAHLSPGTRELLRELASLPGCRVAVMSGRMLSDLRRMVGLPGIAYGGNHGLELSWSDGNGEAGWEHPGAVAARPLLARLLDTLAGELVGIQGAWIEDKGFSLTVHYRLVGPEEVPAVSAVVARAVSSLGGEAEGLLVRSGKATYEVLPRLGWDKGQGVLRLAALLGPEAPILYAGDDMTDEDAFRVLEGGSPDLAEGRSAQRALTILVGGPHDTYAQHCLPDVPSLIGLLVGLAAAPPWLA